MATKATEKAGTKVTFSDGSTGYVTEGKNYRIDSGPNKGKLWSGAAPGTAPAPAAGVPATPVVTQDKLLELQRAAENLQNQVGSGGISQVQADAEFNRLQNTSLNEIRAGNQAASAITGSPNAPDTPQVTPFGEAQGYTPLGSEKNANTPVGITNTQDLLNQQYASRQQALNRPDEVNPFGGKDFIQNPDGTVTQVSTIGNLDPKAVQGWTGQQFGNQSYIDRSLQAIAGEGGQNNQGFAGLLPQLRGMFSKPLDYSGFSAVPTSDQFGAERQRVEDQLYKRFADVNEPIFQKQLEDFQQQMANQGVTPDTVKYKNQFEQLQRAQNDARQGTRAQALGMGGQEQQRFYENALITRGQQIWEAQQLRGQPLSELRGLLSSVNPVQMPQFNQTANINVPATNFAGSAENALTRKANLESAKLGFANQMALAELGASAAAAQQQQGFQNQQALSNQQFQQNQDLQNQNKPGFGDYAAGFLGPVLGAGIGNYLFGGGGSGGSGFFSNLFR